GFTTGIVYDESGLTDTTKQITGLEGAATYYWRVNAVNAGGTSEFSTAFSFTTGFPSTTQLIFPEDNTGNHPIDSVLYWHQTPNTQSYDLQLARAANFNAGSIVLDLTGLTDTNQVYSSLLFDTFYFWRVRGINQYGTGNWSDVWRFKTMPDPTSVGSEIIKIADDYFLEQNFPNPFNPATTIRFNIPESGTVNLKVYNMLGQEVIN